MKINDKQKEEIGKVVKSLYLCEGIYSDCRIGVEGSTNGKVVGKATANIKEILAFKLSKKQRHELFNFLFHDIYSIGKMRLNIEELRSQGVRCVGVSVNLKSGRVTDVNEIDKKINEFITGAVDGICEYLEKDLKI
ncbi:MAG: hypothetical protein LBP53_06695 [Candidatus Peribacteria bacterium]|nr:hypothetical protein [Candidatus Peribacteria bacterium]